MWALESFIFFQLKHTQIKSCFARKTHLETRSFLVLVRQIEQQKHVVIQGSMKITGIPTK